MKAWRITGPHSLQLDELQEPRPSDDEAVLRVKAVGVCGSDIDCFEGTHPLVNYPRLPGHEFAGEVTAVPDNWMGPPVGARVAVDPARYCGDCYACRIGRFNCCTQVSIAGVHRPGALAEYVLVQADQLVPIPDALSFEEAAVVETLSIGAQVALRAEVRKGDLAVILGGGPIGLCSLIMLRRAGAVILLSEPLAWRRELAVKLGAARVIDPNETDLLTAVKNFTEGYGAQVSIDATGEIAGAEAALAVAGSAARIVILTLRNEPMRISPWQLVRQELSISGSRLTRADYAELVGLVVKGEAPIAPLITHRFLFAEAETAFRLACQRPPGHVKSVVKL